ncbi:hypothetical protein B0H19DRAFT_1292492 [Mycena capillaripes]|nr:hypothetical protein B0H19DRAFT_1292492 [Mycena capillaripes]
MWSVWPSQRSQVPKSKAKEIFVLAHCWKGSRTELIPGHILLKTFLYHFDSAKIPKALLPAIENDPSEHAWASFIGLEHKFVSQFSENPDFRIRLWCRYFYIQRVSPINDFDTARGNIGVICGVMHETEGIVALCTQLWIHRAASPALTSYIMHTLLLNSTWEELNQIVATSGDKPDLIAQLAVNRLRTAMNESDMWPAHVSTLTFSLIAISRLPGHCLTDAILSENASWVVTRMFVLVAEARHAAGPNPDPEYLQCLNAGFAFLRFALVREDSPRWIAQSLDAGLLRHMVYPSVVKLVDREMSDIDEAALEAGVQGTWLHDDWLSLMHLAALRSGVAKLPKQLKGAAKTLCESTKCGKATQKKYLLRCTGCLYVYYCSKKCQKDAWPNHRSICKLKKQHRSRDEEKTRGMFTQSDVQFFRELFPTDANHHLPHLHKLAKRQFPTETRGEHFAICLDYTNTTYPSGTCSLKDIRTYTFPPLSGDEADPDNIVAYNDELIKMVRRDPKTYTFIEATFAWGERSISRNFMIRPNLWAHPATPPSNWGGGNACEHEDVEENAAGFIERLLGLDLGLD